MWDESIKVSILMPTFNEEKNIDLVLSKIINQKLEFLALEDHIEIVIIDSGSTDNTLQKIFLFAKKNPQIKIRVYSIPKRLFHHAITRNILAKLSHGDIIVFLNADAIPYNNYWLKELIEPIINKVSVATFSRQIPPKYSINIDAILNLTGFPSKFYVISKRNFRAFLRRYGILFSTTSCAISRSIFFKLGGFNPFMPINEDQEFGIRLLKNGFNIAYNPRSIVIHAHEVDIWSISKRYLNIIRGWNILRRLHPDLKIEFSPRILKSIYCSYNYLIKKIYPLARKRGLYGPSKILKLIIHGTLLATLITIGQLKII